MSADTIIRSSPAEDDPEGILGCNSPDFSSCPPIFVLPTHLTLEALHDIEETLLRRGARLTYDVFEMVLVLGRVGQKKRAALELRSRGLWTEEVALPSSEPPAKRRKVAKERRADPEAAELSSESEGDEVDTAKHLRKPKPSLDRASTASSQRESSATAEQMDIKVVKLEWLDRCIEANELVPISPFVVYQARKTSPPEPTSPTANTSRILQRARGDAESNPPAPPSSQFAARRHKLPDGDDSSQRAPPKLYRQTTSEHDEAVPLPPPPDWVKQNIMYACMRSAPLHPPNESFIAQLVKIRKIRDLTLDEVGVRAYSTSIAAISAYPYEFRRPSEVLSLPGCDTKIANLFAEFLASPTRTLTTASVLDTDPVLKILSMFNNIWGVGAKTAREFYYHRQWRDLDDVVEHGWNSLSRVQQIGVKYYDEFLAGVPRSETEAIAKTITRHANAVRPEAGYDGRGIECVIVGGYRRGKEESGDVDLVLSHRDETVTKNLVVDLVASLESEHCITHTLALHLTTSARDQQTLPYKGDDEASGRHFDSLDKALVVWQDPGLPLEMADGKNKNTNPHRRVDIIISPWRTVGCAVLGWSGDTTFERDLRRYAKKAHGWKFDSSGVRQRTSGGQVVDLERGGRTWEERERLVLEKLGVGWRPPAERCTR